MDIQEMGQALAQQVKTQADLRDVTRALMTVVLESALNAELDTQLGSEKHAKADDRQSNTRNGTSAKTLKGDHGAVDLAVPRDRDASFAPQIVPKGKTRIEGFEDQMLALYSRGMTTRDVQAILKDMYNAEISHTVIANVTDAVINEVTAWQQRPLEPVSPLVFLDGLVVKVHHDQRVINKTIYVALGITTAGQKELLGLWIAETEGAKCWRSVLTDLQTRGVQDIFIACVDGLTGFPEAIAAAFPKTKIQLCLVHMVRHSLRYVPAKDRKAVAAGLKTLSHARNVSEAATALDTFADAWSTKSPNIEKSWRRHWDTLITMFDYPEEIRNILYTTNAIESLNSVVRKAIRNRKIFPSDPSALKIVSLAIKNASKRWTMPLREGKPAMNRFAIEYGERFEAV